MLVKKPSQRSFKFLNIVRQIFYFRWKTVIYLNTRMTQGQLQLNSPCICHKLSVQFLHFTEYLKCFIYYLCSLGCSG